MRCWGVLLRGKIVRLGLRGYLRKLVYNIDMPLVLSKLIANSQENGYTTRYSNYNQRSRVAH
jgi:hypothetical protein